MTDLKENPEARANALAGQNEIQNQDSAEHSKPCNSTQDGTGAKRRLLEIKRESLWNIGHLADAHLQLMLGSLAMLLSLCVHPFLASVLAFFAGNGLYSHYNPLFYIFPSYSAFNVFGQVLAGSLISGREVLVLSFYAVDFVVLMLLVALWRFRTKELV